MRLIDADSINWFKGEDVDGNNVYLLDKRDINEEPTAYDIDKVVDELGKAKCEISLSGDDLEYYQNGLDDAIGIVKQGCVTDVCDWKHFSNDKSPYRPSCSQYMRSKFDAFKIGDYCQFCGNKIKVVE